MDPKESKSPPPDGPENQVSTNDNYRFIDINNRFSSVDKRIDDLKGTISLMITLSAFIFGIASVIFTYNFNSAKEDLKTFETNLSTQLTGKGGPPKIEIYSMDHQNLSDKTIPAMVYFDHNPKNGYKTDTMLKFTVILKNTGQSPTGLINLKVYANDPIQFEDASTDENKFKYEFYHFSANMNPNNLSAKISVEMILTMQIHQIPKPGEYTCMLKSYCENGGLMSQDSFKIQIK